MASGANKPNGLTVILPEDAIAFVEQLQERKVSRHWRSDSSKMHKLGIRTGTDLKDY